ncbi:hypothetical protein J437_LFUL003536 [Ladona fulva]|uniref:Uncharacterized protein n=1 Tax=Ladona fulva TaxID=123851 RepID=A0A8K0NUY8_LADFU|nr:hypothetical protein J437_LFUL003536 [Ladona fulva]
MDYPLDYSHESTCMIHAESGFFIALSLIAGEKLSFDKVRERCNFALDVPACNRTYWGESGESYELEVRRPAEDALPFQCTLNFTAAGGPHGDIVQITFLSFAVGTFAGWGVKGDGGGSVGGGEEGVGGGCPDGGVGVAEAGLPPTGGLWCGTAWGHSTYFSETHSVALYLTLLRLPAHQHFHFRVSYRLVRQSHPTVPPSSTDKRETNEFTLRLPLWRADPPAGRLPVGFRFIGDVLIPILRSREQFMGFLNVALHLLPGNI